MNCSSKIESSLIKIFPIFIAFAAIYGGKDFVLLFQLSFIQHSLINPEIFCFADYPCHTVATDILKAPPEDDNREIATW